jgi:hypothetical protein
LQRKAYYDKATDAEIDEEAAAAEGEEALRLQVQPGAADIYCVEMRFTTSTDF